MRRPGVIDAQAAACRHASRNTYRPIGTIRPGFFGDTDELRRRHQPRVRVLPAHSASVPMSAPLDAMSITGW